MNVHPIHKVKCETCWAELTDLGDAWADQHGQTECDGAGHMPDGEILWVALTTDGVAMNESAYCDKHYDDYDESVVADAEDWSGDPTIRTTRHDDLRCNQCAAEETVDRMIAGDAARH